MSEETEDETELFEPGETIVLTLKDGRHYLGEFVGYWDDGLGMKLEAKTAVKIIKAENKAFNNYVDVELRAKMEALWTPLDLLEKFQELNPGMSVQGFTNSQLKEHVRGQLLEQIIEAANHLFPPARDTEIKYLKELKRSIRTLVSWHKIDEVCSATEMAEEAQIADFDNLIENDEFYKLIEKPEE